MNHSHRFKFGPEVIELEVLFLLKCFENTQVFTHFIIIIPWI
jgi:hypothetical protein